MLKSKANWIRNEQAKDISIIDHLLHDKGLETEEEKAQFLHPKIEHIQSPTALSGVEKAKQRIFTAMEQEEKVMVYGDYDADGVTSTALLMTVLMELGVHCDYYIPNRFDEGYGLNEDAIHSFSQKGYKVIVTVDNGIADVDEAEVAKEAGIDLIITDHHEMQETLPDAYAVIHPKLSDTYLFKELAGVGVAFQFAHYLLEYFPSDLLEYVVIGTIADLVPLYGENRVLAYFGLESLTNTVNIGIQALKNKCGISGEVTEKDIGFMLAPRLNAVGRLQSAMLAVELLLTDDEEVAEQIATEIEAINTERKQIGNDIVLEAEKRVNHDNDVIVLYDENWHEGVLGIAASRLVRTFDRPVIMLHYNPNTNVLKGSARSIPGFNLFENGMAIQHLFTAFGGHAQAAGMSLPFDNLEAVQTALNKQINQQLSKEDFKQTLFINQTINLEQMTEKLVGQINHLAPFGMGNQEPNFLMKAIPTQIRQIGQDKNHLKLQFKYDKVLIDAIGFGFGEIAPMLSNRTEISLVGTLQINEWNGNKTVQMMIKDVAVDEWQLFDYRGRQQSKFFTPYLLHYERNLLLGDNMEKMKTIIDSEMATFITYDTPISELDKTDILYVCDMPKDITTLQTIVQTVEPTNIHISYEVIDSAYFQAMPSREDFKWLYGYALKFSPIQLKVDLPHIIKSKKWSKEKVIFMIKVFLDLQFITIKDDTLYVNSDAVKQDLTASRTYQQQLQQSEIEQTLYYATYEEIKQWFDESVTANAVNKGEMVHGL